jgi:hypothetical protein
MVPAYPPVAISNAKVETRRIVRSRNIKESLLQGICFYYDGYGKQKRIFPPRHAQVGFSSTEMKCDA